MKKFSFLLFILIILPTLIFCGCNKTDAKNYFLTETLSYKGIDITINKVEEKISTDDRGNYLLNIQFTMKNNKTKSFKFNYDDFKLKTADKGEIYEHTGQSVSAELFGEEINAGMKVNYTLLFYVPYSLSEKNYVLLINFGLLSSKQEYNLFFRN